jgi:LacI family transcriptional regulator
MILASAHLNDASVAQLRADGVPHVLVNRFSDERTDAFVGSDDLAGARLMTNHLIGLGHRRIAHLTGARGVSTSVLRTRGYQAALEEAGIAPDPGLIQECGYTEDGGRRATLRLLDLPPESRPTAIFAVNDLAALGACSAIRARGLEIPDQVAVAGYNDLPNLERTQPALTTIRVPVHEMGVVAGGILIAQIESAELDSRRVVFTPELVVRGSTVRVDTDSHG